METDVKVSTEPQFQSIFSPGVKIKKIRTDSDLSRCSLSWLIGEYISELGENPRILFVNSDELWVANEIVPLLGFLMKVIPIPLFKKDSWAIAGDKGIFWSPGA